MILQEQVIKEFLYLDRGCQSRTEEEREEEERKKGERKGLKRSGGEEDGGAGLYISISTREKCRTHKANEQERRGHDYY